jgi:coenzyme PQQ precursor peptide PqqA
VIAAVTEALSPAAAFAYILRSRGRHPARPPRNLTEDQRIVKRKWTAPRVWEIAVGMEINCYACAEL